ncbi:hypothetical protein GCM10017674_74690 [Streptomyces gardneri]|uniref:Uncharacterized protein n=1 Tax=Streptomyces gardneri TaxID=66892 RepID=A0A4Y3RR09_9ACTN|nr:hypothetical protein SGA01_56170 [Streptomyces gardneri]GHH20671.1 hypothetical protein GCM10017674_74690 [Streptomyces gardneri]
MAEVAALTGAAPAGVGSAVISIAAVAAASTPQTGLFTYDSRKKKEKKKENKEKEGAVGGIPPTATGCSHGPEEGPDQVALAPLLTRPTTITAPRYTFAARRQAPFQK